MRGHWAFVGVVVDMGVVCDASCGDGGGGGDGSDGACSDAFNTIILLA